MGQTMKKKHKKHKKHKKKRRRDAEDDVVDEEDFKEEPVVIEEEDGDTCVVRIEPKPVKKARRDKDKNGKIKWKIKTPEGVQVKPEPSYSAGNLPDLPSDLF